jgi:hypothetical protein
MNVTGTITSISLYTYTNVFIHTQMLAIPAVPLAASAGYLFGVTKGTLVVLLSATIAAGGAFMIGRLALRQWWVPDVCVCVCVCIYMYTCKCMCAHIYMYTYIHCRLLRVTSCGVCMSVPAIMYVWACALMCVYFVSLLRMEMV